VLRKCEVDLDCFAVTDEQRILEAYAAVKREDWLVVEGLVSRGAVFKVERGTRVHEHMRSSALSRVRIETGFHVGRYCWIPTHLLM